MIYIRDIGLVIYHRFRLDRLSDSLNPLVRGYGLLLQIMCIIISDITRVRNPPHRRCLFSIPLVDIDHSMVFLVKIMINERWSLPNP